MIEVLPVLQPCCMIFYYIVQFLNNAIYHFIEKTITDRKFMHVEFLRSKQFRNYLSRITLLSSCTKITLLTCHRFHETELFMPRKISDLFQSCLSYLITSGVILTAQ